MIYAIVGQTNSGKSTLARDLVTATGIKQVITYTTRPIREGEREGVDYYFITSEEMDKDNFFGRRDFYTVYREEPYSYAINKDDVFPFEDSVLIIDPLGVREIKDYLGKDFVTTVYLDIPEETIIKRAQKRGDSKEEIERRLAADKPLFESAKYYSDICLQESDDMLKYMYDIIKGR